MSVLNGHRYYYTQQVVVPAGFTPVEPVIQHDKTGHRFVWRDTRWVHIARCSCWRNPR